MKVLVIEDEEMLLKAIKIKLINNKYEVLAVDSGTKALVELKNGYMPDVIWLDYYLKDINGVEIVTRLKENKLWKNIPIMVVSNSASDQKVHNLLALGVSKYILKADYRLEEIIEMINSLVKN